MSFHITCRCGKKLRAKLQFAGKRMRCTGCGEAVAVPHTHSDADVDPPADPSVCAEFRRKRGIQYAVLPVAMFGMLLVTIAWFDQNRGIHRILTSIGIPAAVFLIVGLSIVIALAIVSIINWRCPICRRYLGKSLWIDTCPRCGVRVEPLPNAVDGD